MVSRSRAPCRVLSSGTASYKNQPKNVPLVAQFLSCTFTKYTLPIHFAGISAFSLHTFSQCIKKRRTAFAMHRFIFIFRHPFETPNAEPRGSADTNTSENTRGCRGDFSHLAKSHGGRRSGAICSANRRFPYSTANLRHHVNPVGSGSGHSPAK